MIQQGHRYTDGNREYLAMENTDETHIYVDVCQIDVNLPYPLRPLERISTHGLRPMPMAYFHGQVPR